MNWELTLVDGQWRVGSRSATGDYVWYRDAAIAAAKKNYGKSLPLRERLAPWAKEQEFQWITR